MKRLILLLFALLLVGSVKAQWSISPEVGMADIKSEEDFKWSPRVKFGVGVEYEFVPGLFSVKSGLYYTQRGHDYNYYHWGYGEEDEQNYLQSNNVHVNRGFLQIPLMANLTRPITEDISLNLGFGGYLAPALHSSYSHSGYYTSYPYDRYGYSSQYTPGNSAHGYMGPYGGYEYRNMYGGYYTEDLVNFDWGLSLVAGIEMKNILVNFGYDMALGKEWHGDGARIKYHTLTLGVGYKFRLGKSPR